MLPDELVRQLETGLFKAWRGKTLQQAAHAGSRGEYAKIAFLILAYCARLDTDARLQRIGPGGVFAVAFSHEPQPLHAAY